MFCHCARCNFFTSLLIQFIEDDVFCASSSFGGVGLFRISENSEKAVITRLTYWDSVHFHGLVVAVFTL